ncbi:hypothetical protein C8R26_11776 [Nitrosomonas oligotropha]|uniref:Uncharacterized protein n=1 Tax=Nitrosomonas oligotropha TaxID=42354 RepID=A0A2T5HY18_9PROT|nr:hypothetical protein C8R26_11776 [Nitrosomonas oligotropha]
MSTMTQRGMLVLKEFAPRGFLEAMKQGLLSSPTVVIYHSVETWAGFVAKTTFTTQDGYGRSRNVIEFCYLEAYQLSMPEKLAMQLVKQTSRAREYRVSTLPLTLLRVRNLKPELSFDGLQVDLFQE